MTSTDDQDILTYALQAPKLVYVGQACTKCYKRSVSLSKCSRCRLAAYCSKFCQIEDHNLHKNFCAKYAEKPLLEPFPDFTTHSRKEMEEWSVWTARCDRSYLCYSLGRSLTLSEQNFIIFKPRCIICFKGQNELASSRTVTPQDEGFANPREETLLIRCHHCRMRFACSAHHWELGNSVHRTEPIENGLSECQLYRQGTEDAYAARHLFELIRQQSNGPNYGLNWTTTALRTTQLPLPTLDDLNAYGGCHTPPEQISQPWRNIFSEFIDCMLPKAEHARNNTRWQTVPLTVLYGLDRCTKACEEPLSSYTNKPELVLHVIDATPYDVFVGRSFEELLVLLPNLERLRVHFIGQDLLKLHVRDKPAVPMVSSSCQAAGKRLEFFYHEMLYHHWVAMSTIETNFVFQHCWTRPDLAIAFSASMHEHPGTWHEIIDFLISADVPTLVTSHNREEASAEAAVVKSRGGNIVLQESRNPFRCELAEPEPCSVSGFFFINGYVLGFKGRMAKEEALDIAWMSVVCSENEVAEEGSEDEDEGEEDGIVVVI